MLFIEKLKKKILIFNLVVLLLATLFFYFSGNTYADPPKEQIYACSVLLAEDEKKDCIPKDGVCPGDFPDEKEQGFSKATYKCCCAKGPICSKVPRVNPNCPAKCGISSEKTCTPKGPDGTGEPQEITLNLIDSNKKPPFNKINKTVKIGLCDCPTSCNEVASAENPQCLLASCPNSRDKCEAVPKPGAKTEEEKKQKICDCKQWKLDQCGSPSGNTCPNDPKCKNSQDKCRFLPKSDPDNKEGKDLCVCRPDCGSDVFPMCINGYCDPTTEPGKKCEPVLDPKTSKAECKCYIPENCEARDIKKYICTGGKCLDGQQCVSGQYTCKCEPKEKECNKRPTNKCTGGECYKPSSTTIDPDKFCGTIKDKDFKESCGCKLKVPPKKCADRDYYTYSCWGGECPDGEECSSHYDNPSDPFSCKCKKKPTPPPPPPEDCDKRISGSPNFHTCYGGKCYKSSSTELDPNKVCESNGSKCGCFDRITCPSYCSPKRTTNCAGGETEINGTGGKCCCGSSFCSNNPPTGKVCVAPDKDNKCPSGYGVPQDVGTEKVKCCCKEKPLPTKCPIFCDSTTEAGSCRSTEFKTKIGSDYCCCPNNICKDYLFLSPSDRLYQRCANAETEEKQNQCKKDSQILVAFRSSEPPALLCCCPNILDGLVVGKDGIYYQSLSLAKILPSKCEERDSNQCTGGLCTHKGSDYSCIYNQGKCECVQQELRRSVLPKESGSKYQYNSPSDGNDSEFQEGGDEVFYAPDIPDVNVDNQEEIQEEIINDIETVDTATDASSESDASLDAADVVDEYEGLRIKDVDEPSDSVIDDTIQYDDTYLFKDDNNDGVIEIIIDDNDTQIQTTPTNEPTIETPTFAPSIESPPQTEDTPNQIEDSPPTAASTPVEETNEPDASPTSASTPVESNKPESPPTTSNTPVDGVIERPPVIQQAPFLQPITQPPIIP